MAFGIHLQGLDTQKAIVDDIRSQIGSPPAGVSADVAGLPVLAAESNGKLSSGWRRALTLLAGLAAVFLVLLAIRRKVELAAVPLIPIAFATGWSALILFVIGIPLNPMSATLGALVIAISTEFSVLLSARYREQRARGEEPGDAIDSAYRSTGAAVLASGATAIAGFAALIASDIQMLREFGVVTVVDLTVSLLGVMVVLPAALVWAEEHGQFSLRDLDPRRFAAAARAEVAAGVGDLRWRPPSRPRLTLPRLGGLRPGRRRTRA
jgi:predicted RND superfamily exporter protein